VAYNEIQQSGNTVVNISDVYPEGKFMDYYFPGFTPEYDGMDWASVEELQPEKSLARWI